MKKFGFFILFGGIFLIVFIIHTVVSSSVVKRNYRKGPPFSISYVFTDTTITLLTDIRRTNYEIIPKPVYSYDDDGELEVEYTDYDRGYYGGGYKGGSYSGGK